MFSDWLDYYNEVYFFLHCVKSLLLLLRKAQLWICPQQSSHDSGFFRVHFLFFPGHIQMFSSSNCWLTAVLFSTMPWGINFPTHDSSQIFSPLKEQFPRSVSVKICSDSRKFPLSSLSPVFFPENWPGCSLACIFIESMNLLPVDFHHNCHCFSEHPKA